MKRIIAILAFSLMASASFAVNISKTGVISKIYQCHATANNFSMLEFKVDDTWFRVASMATGGTSQEIVAQYNTVLALYLAERPITVVVPTTSTNTANSCGITGTSDNPSAGTVYYLWGNTGYIGF